MCDVVRLVMLRQVLVKAVFSLDEMEEAAVLFDEAQAMHAAGQFLEADRRYDTVFLNQVQYLGPVAASIHLDVAETLLAKAKNSLWLSKFSLSKTLFQQAIAIFRKKLGGDNEGVLRGVLGLAAVLAAERRHDEAFSLRQRVFVSQQKLLQISSSSSIDTGNPNAGVADDENPTLCRTRLLIVGDLLELGKYDLALQLALGALSGLRKIPESEAFADLACLHTYMGRIYIARGAFTDAQHHIDEALSILEAAYPDRAHYSISAVLQARAQLLHATGRLHEAHKLMATVVKRRIKAFGASNAMEFSKNTAMHARMAFFDALDSLSSVEGASKATSSLGGDDEASVASSKPKAKPKKEVMSAEDQELEEEMSAFADIEKEFRNGRPANGGDENVCGDSFNRFGTSASQPAVLTVKGLTSGGVPMAPHTLVAESFLVRARISVVLADLVRIVLCSTIVCFNS